MSFLHTSSSSSSNSRRKNSRSSREDTADPNNIAAALRKERDKIRNAETVVFEKVYKLCLDQIKFINSRGGGVCRFSIPLFLSGAPLYDLHDCAGYLLAKLKAAGFTTLFFEEPDVICIEW